MKNFWVVLAFLASVSVHAGGFYYEFGAGAGMVSSAQGFFGGTTPSQTNFGFAGNFMIGKNLAYSGGEFFQLHLGIKSFLINASGDGMEVSYWPTCLLLRLHMPLLYLGAGFTSFVMSRANSEAYPGNYEFSPATLAGVVEAGFNWRVTPFFNIALEGSAHVAKPPTGDLSPSPALAATVQFRVYFTDDFPDGDSQRKIRFDGWRYPFGIEIND